LQKNKQKMVVITAPMVAATLAAINLGINLLSKVGSNSVAIQIDNWYKDYTASYVSPIYVREGKCTASPKETINKGTKNTAGGFNSRSGTVRYKIGDVCVDTMWCQGCSDLSYRTCRYSGWTDLDQCPYRGDQRTNGWYGFAISVGRDLCGITTEASYTRMKKRIKSDGHNVNGYNFNFKFSGTKTVGGWEKRGLDLDKYIRFDDIMDIKPSMDDNSKSVLRLEIGPQNYWLKRGSASVVRYNDKYIYVENNLFNLTDTQSEILYGLVSIAVLFVYLYILYCCFKKIYRVLCKRKKKHIRTVRYAKVNDNSETDMSDV